MVWEALLPICQSDVVICISRRAEADNAQAHNVSTDTRDQTQKVLLSANRRCLSARLFQPYADVWIAYQADAELSIKCRMIWSSSTIKTNCCISRTLKRQKWTTIVDLAHVQCTLLIACQTLFIYLAKQRIRPQKLQAVLLPMLHGIAHIKCRLRALTWAGSRMFRLICLELLSLNIAFDLNIYLLIYMNVAFGLLECCFWFVWILH